MSSNRGQLTGLTGVLLLAAGLGACALPGRHLPPAEAYGGDPARGQAAIARYGCGSCHVIPGVGQAKGLVGPPLTQFGRRSYIAGEVPNTDANLQKWIRDPQSIESHTVMPNLHVTRIDARDISAYLLTLG